MSTIHLSTYTNMSEINTPSSGIIIGLDSADHLLKQKDSEGNISEIGSGSGLSGTSGSSGTSGIKGTSGTSGNDGVDGSNGLRWLYTNDANNAEFSLSNSDFTTSDNTLLLNYISLFGPAKNWVESMKQYLSYAKIHIKITEIDNKNNFVLYEVKEVIDDEDNFKFNIDCALILSNETSATIDKVYSISWTAMGGESGSSGTSGNSYSISNPINNSILISDGSATNSICKPTLIYGNNILALGSTSSTSSAIINNHGSEPNINPFIPYNLITSYIANVSDTEFVGIGSQNINGIGNDTPTIFFGDSDGKLQFSYIPYIGGSYSIINNLMTLDSIGNLYLLATPSNSNTNTQVLTRNSTTGKIDYMSKDKFVSLDLNNDLYLLHVTYSNIDTQILTRDPQGKISYTNFDNLKYENLPTHDDNEKALEAQLTPGTVYKTSTGALMVVYEIKE